MSKFGYDLVEEESGYRIPVIYGEGAPGPRGIPGVAGPPGRDGEDAPMIELRKDNDEIQWRRVGEVTWQTLAPLTNLRGARGPQGTPGQDGSGFKILGTKPTVGDLPDPGNDGDAWLVGTTVHLWGSANGDPDAWIAVGDVTISGATLETLALRKDFIHARQRQPVMMQDSFTNAFTGEFDAGLLPAGTEVADATGTIDGTVEKLGPGYRVTGQITMALRERVAVHPDGIYELRAVAARHADPSDPLNDAVTVNVAYLDASFDEISREELVRESLVEAPGEPNVLDVSLILTKGPGQNDQDGNSSTAIPDATVYMVAFFQTYGIDGEVDLISLDLKDIGQKISAPSLIYPDNYRLPQEIVPGAVVDRTLFVTANGDDSNNGDSLGQGVATIEQAMDLIDQRGEPHAVQVWPGRYETAGHIDVPDLCTGIIAATNSRSTKIVPSTGNEVKNVFRLGDGGYVEGFSFEGWQVDDLDNPTEGFAISFRPDAEIYRTVFAFNITVFRGQQASLIEAPLDRENGNPLVGNGPGVALADASIVSNYSVFPQIMLWGATPVSPNGIGYCAKNGAFLNGINAVALWMHKHYLALNGGEVILTNCASQFGDWTLWSEGSCLEPIPYEVPSGTPMDPDPSVGNVLLGLTTTIADEAWPAIQAQYPGISEANTKRDSALLVRALAYDIITGTDKSIQLFQRGLFDFEGRSIIPAGQKAAFLFGFDAVRDRILARGLSEATEDFLGALLQTVRDMVNFPKTRTKPSKITSVGHQWNNVLAGVNGRALFKTSERVEDSVITRNLGTVTSSGVDDFGKQYFSGGAVVNPLSGQLEGPPIDRTILPRARRAAQITGGQL